MGEAGNADTSPKLLLHHAAERAQCPAMREKRFGVWTAWMLARVIDKGVELRGGYGFMLQYPIARAWADARAQRIYGGASAGRPRQEPRS